MMGHHGFGDLLGTEKLQHLENSANNQPPGTYGARLSGACCKEGVRCPALTN